MRFPSLHRFVFCIAPLLLFGSAGAQPDLKHIVVYQEDGKFAGWPANNGAWIFEGDELLIGFTRGTTS